MSATGSSNAGSSSSMEGLIPIINELQNVFSAVGSSAISLPQLVVVGSQSSGKSSVLEHIVGRDFLPRGTGIVTRRPLVLQLNHVPTEEDEEEGEGPAADEGRRPSAAAAARPQQQQQQEWGEFLHLPGKKFFDFDQIRDEITRETERVCHGKSISHQALNLAIFSPHVLTLTLVDLPGITKVAVAGQPEDIEAQINAMILSYISSPHSIIVAVSSANTDIANSDSLKLAREVDPSGIRTLGVLTKIDLMDRGTDSVQILNNNSGVELQHGFVGVVCRSQEAITQRRSIRDALLAEKNFFSSHPIYRSIASRLGTPFLAKKLNAILMQHIQSSLPDIRNKITATIQETQAELDSYGAKGQENQDNSTILLPLISKYVSHLNDALEGRSPDVSTTELYGGARINYVFSEIFGQSLLAIDPLDLLSDHDIRISIRNASGPRPSLFIPEIAFELLTKKQIERLLQPSLDCIDLVFHELQRVALQCELLSPELIRFPHLRVRMLHVFQTLLKSCLEPTKAHIEALIQCELSFINTSHVDFIGGSAAVAIIMERIHRMQQKSAASGAGGHPFPSSSSSSAASDLSSKVAGVTGNLTMPSKHHSASPSEATADTVGKPSTHNYYQHSRTEAHGGPTTNGHSAASTAAAAASKPAQGFLASFFRSPPPAAEQRKRFSGGHHQQQQQQQHHHHLQSQQGEVLLETNSLDSMHEHDLYSSNAPAAASSHAHALAAVGAGAPSWHLRSVEPTERDVVETEVIKILMQSYFGIVRKNIMDAVPKAVMCFLVLRIKKEIQAVLVRDLYQPQLLDELLREADDIAEKRECARELLVILQRAIDILNSARDYVMS